MSRRSPGTSGTDLGRATASAVAPRTRHRPLSGVGWRSRGGASLARHPLARLAIWMPGGGSSISAWLQGTAGVALLLAGMRVASLGLREQSERLREGLRRLTGRPLAAAVTAALATALIHSSSVSTMAIVGLVQAEALDLETAAAAVIGANVGVTLPIQLLSWRPGPLLWLPVVAAGCLLLFGRRRAWGEGLIGFGCLLGGLTLLDGAVAPLAARPWFAGSMLLLAQRPWAGLAAGAVLATIALSSSVTLGVLQGLATQGLLPLRAALPVVLGANVGTTTDTLLVSLGTGRDGRRAALVHLLFNLCGALGFMLARGPFAAVASGSSAEPARQLANAHLLFNLATALCLYPLRKRLVRLTGVMLPGPHGG
jgi:phosphate:Na+ symporter